VARVAASLAIRGGRVELDVRDGLITDAATATAAVLDASGCRVVPGFVDVQINGGFGVDVTSEPERVGELAAALPATGVTSFVPTVVSASTKDTAHAVDVLARAPHAHHGARRIGIHLEGPFLHESRRGAHGAGELRLPTLAEARSWPGVTMVTLAPELPGALDVIRDLTNRGVVVCIGHTTADDAELDAAFAAGATGATHLYNAMGPFGARAPGTVGALLAHPTVVCGLIVDGVHVHPTMVAVAWRALGREQIALVTDATAALGAPPGEYRIGDIDVTADERATWTDGRMLAGSVLRMDQAVRNLVAFTGCTWDDAAHAAATTPARLAGRPDLGVLTSGAPADVVLLDHDGCVAATVVGGDVVFDRDGRFTR
jgi:N-acetylglucosamine-6-phosphate deacetylase